MAKKHSTQQRQAQVAVLSFQITDAGAQVQLLPAGTFRAKDGRPHNAPAWRLTADIAASVVARAQGRSNALVIDYEHQTLNTELNGQPAPAAGWFHQLEFRPDSGLWATDVQWTDRARQMIDSGEYRYISAVFSYMPGTGEVLEIYNAALTNDPAIDGMAAVRAAARFAGITHVSQEENTVDQEQLKKLLGLDGEVTEDELQQAIVALKAKADRADEAETKVKGLETAVAAAKAEAKKGVPTEVVDELRTEIAALKAKDSERAIDDLVQEGVDKGVLVTKGLQDWARQQDVASLRAYLDNAQPVAALKGTQTGGKPPAGAKPGVEGDGAELTETQLAICKNCGIDPEDFKKQLAEEAK